MSTSNDSLRHRATEAARDLILENNDAPLGVQDLLTLCYVRGFTDGVKHSSNTLAAELQAVRS